MNKTNKYEFFFREEEDKDAELLGYPASRYIRHCSDIHQDAVWAVPLKEFVAFLSAIYGYDIRQKIIIKSLLPDDFFETQSPNQELTDELLEENDTQNWEIFK